MTYNFNLLKFLKHYKLILINKFMKNEIIYRLMNHDSSGEKPEFHKYNIIELNEQFNTKYLSAEEASQADPEYLFTEEEMLDYIDAE